MCRLPGNTDLYRAASIAACDGVRMTGGCHCGNLRIELTLSKPPSELPLRACGCTFCTAHAAVHVADPDGLFEVRAGDDALVERYRFGTSTADFLLCRRCGVYVGAICDGRAVVNVLALADRAAFTQPPAPASFEGETAEIRLARRAARWMPARF